MTRTKRKIRTTSSFLYHTYPESSGKGSSACQFTLGEVYRQLGGVKNANLSYESFDQDAMNVTTFTKILERATKKARGEERLEKSGLIVSTLFMLKSVKENPSKLVFPEQIVVLRQCRSPRKSGIVKAAFHVVRPFS